MPQEPSEGFPATTAVRVDAGVRSWAHAHLARLAALSALPLALEVALKSMGEPIRSEDLWWHLGMGRVIAVGHAVPRSDAFSYLRFGSPYFDQPWLAQLCMYALHACGGLAGLLACDFVVMIAAEALALFAAMRRGASFTVASLVQLALAPVAWRGWAMRPQAFAVPIFATFVYVLAAYRKDARAPLWLLPVLMLAWANLHGSFPLGLVLVLLTLGAAWLDHRVALRPLVWAALGCAVAPMVNPRGPALLGYVRSLLDSSTVRAIAREWQPLNLADSEGRYVAAILVGALVLGLQRRARLGDWLLVAPFALLELRAVRNGIWLSLVLGPIAAGWLARSPNALTPRLPRHALAVTALAASVLVTTPWWKPRLVPMPYGALAWHQRTPIAAVSWMAQTAREPRRLFHGMGAGSYLIWARPSQPVFIDPRIELYPRAQWNDALALRAGERVSELTTRYHFDAWLLDQHDDAPLIAALRKHRELRLRYEDADSVYFERR
jgi:hypothetical protein